MCVCATVCCGRGVQRKLKGISTCFQYVISLTASTNEAGFDPKNSPLQSAHSRSVTALRRASATTVLIRILSTL